VAAKSTAAAATTAIDVATLLALDRPRVMPSPFAEVRHVTKSFGEIAAVRAVTCPFRLGEIHAVCGENGAGKSTLLKLAAGMLVPDAGEVEVAGAFLAPHTPREAIQRGVAMVLQHFALVPVFTTLENIMLGAEPTELGMLGVLDERTGRARVEAIAADLGAVLPLGERVESLGIGDRQRIEIARALFRDARLLILDEPTAVLTKAEVAALYATLRRLVQKGKGIVVVTHKMDEVRAHADVVTVMRRGELVFTRPLDRGGDVKAQVDDVTAAIMGAVRSQVQSGRAKEEDKPAEAPMGDADVLVMTDVTVGRGLVGVSLRLRPGEIVGVAGVEGNGQRELVAVLAGDLAPDTGTITGGPLAIVREDRQTEGLVLDASLRDNLMLGELGRFARWGILDVATLEREARSRLESSGAPLDLDRRARALSGGNQQKIVVARALRRHANVVVAAQPTRGVDLAASLDIHAELVGVARRGAGVLVISADLDELRRLASRIVVLARGRIVAELPPTATDDELGRLMLGVGDAGGVSVEAPS
jgi:simple sugar transport system ATP-binding protein